MVIHKQIDHAIGIGRKRKRRGRIAHPAFGIVDPYAQCDLTKMCGVYAVFNAYRLALGAYRGLRHRKATDLFSQLLEQWQAEGVLADTMISGIGVAKAKRLARSLVKSLSTPAISLAIEVPDKATCQAVDDLLDWIDDSLAHACPVVLHMCGDITHFTVIGASDGKQLECFDSDYLKVLDRSRIGIKSGDHQISAASMFRIRATAREPDTLRTAVGITVVTGDLV